MTHTSRKININNQIRTDESEVEKDEWKKLNLFVLLDQDGSSDQSSKSTLVDSRLIYPIPSPAGSIQFEKKILNGSC